MSDSTTSTITTPSSSESTQTHPWIQDETHHPHSTYIYRLSIDTKELLQTDDMQDTLTPPLVHRFLLLHRDPIFKCWRGLVGIPTMNPSSSLVSSSSVDAGNSNTFLQIESDMGGRNAKGRDESVWKMVQHQVCPLIDRKSEELSEEFIYELNQVEKPVEYTGYTRALFHQLEIDLEATDIQYMEGLTKEEFHHDTLYWFGFDCNHSLAMALLALNRLDKYEEMDMANMLSDLLLENPMDFIDISPIEYVTDDDSSNLKDVLEIVNQVLPERSFKTFTDCMDMLKHLNQVLICYEELLRQQKYLQLSTGNMNLDLNQMLQNLQM